jgi:hypothetical protein
MRIIKIMMLCIASIATADTHSTLFDTCAVSGCVACEPTDRIEDGNAKNIGVWLQPTFYEFSADESGITGFFPGHEGERPEKQGLGVDHTEFYWSATKEDQLRGNAVIAIAEHDGETEIEFEEAYVETIKSYLLPDGMNLKLGRAFWTFGALNAQHTHSDSFADRPLPYRAFLNNAFNDDGLEVSYKLPVDFFAVIGAGSFRGNDFPFGLGEEAEAGNEATSGYIRLGSNLSEDSSWRVGAYMLSGNAGSRQTSHTHNGNSETFTFSGESDLYAYDIRLAVNKLTLSGEYFNRKETGNLNIRIDEVNTTPEDDTFTLTDIDTRGWYLSAVYEINEKIRIGARYSKLGSPDYSTSTNNDLLATGDDALLSTAHEGEFNAGGHDPVARSYMVDWKHSECSLIRFQLNDEELSDGNTDEQFIVQYIMHL